jgi:NAD(P)H-hydrate epimerase
MATAAGIDLSGWQGHLPAAELFVDALLGFGATGAPRGNVAEMIDAINRSATPALSIDVPSGVDLSPGAAPDTAVQATATVTLALPKAGLLTEAARPLAGRLFLADIGIPRSLLAGVGIDPTGLFESDDIIEI